MDYRRQENVIRAGFALHAWRLLKHYEQLTEELSPAGRYEATLTLCVLQSLLTNCWELWKYLNDKKASRVLETLHRYTLSMLADPEVEVTNSFSGQPDAKAVVVHIRNALSHPRMRETDPPTTGYTTVEDSTGYLSRLRFTDSPDLNSRGGLRREALERTGGEVNQAQVFTIELPLILLTSWAEEIALVLAQPVMDNWDSPELVALVL